MSKILEKSLLTFLEGELPLDKVEEDLDIIIFGITNLLPSKATHYQMNRYFENDNWDLKIWYREDDFQKALIISKIESTFNIGVI